VDINGIITPVAGGGNLTANGVNATNANIYTPMASSKRAVGSADRSRFNLFGYD
jgi:hypothetical protein